jgi:hypothetical protein
LSDESGSYQLAQVKHHRTLRQRLSKIIHRCLIERDSFGARFLEARLKTERAATDGTAKPKGPWHAAMGLSTVYRKSALGCVSCGDCIQDHLNYTGCTMHWCYKNLRNGPCGGSRTNGGCENDPDLPCIWNTVYLGTAAAGEDPRRFARTLIPPRDWCLDQTNALSNRLVGVDNSCRRVTPAG